MLPKVSAALSQLIKPITSSDQTALQKPFERFSAQEHRDSRKQERQDSSLPESKQPSASAPDNVIPMENYRAPAPQGPSHPNSIQGSSLSLLGLLSSLKEKRVFLSRVGQMIYEKVRKDQGKARLRKGAILDRNG